MKRKLQKINPYMRDIATFCEFQLIFSSSNLEIGIDHIPKSEEDLVEMPKYPQGEYTGCIWQTAIMGENFERFGDFISIDDI